MKQVFDGVGRVMIFNSDIRRGIAAVEEHICEAIENGSERVVINAIKTVDGEPKLAPTIVTIEQVRLIALEGYRNVLENYSFFNSAPETFEDWIIAEMVRRVKSQMGEAEGAGVRQIANINEIVRGRQQAFDAFTGKKGVNAARRRKADWDDLVEVAGMIWDLNMRTHNKTPRSIEQISSNSGKSVNWLKTKFRTTDYLKALRIAIARTRSDDKRVKWLEKINPNVFADRMFLPKRVVEGYLNDIRMSIAKKGEEKDD